MITTSEKIVTKTIDTDRDKIILACPESEFISITLRVELEPNYSLANYKSEIATEIIDWGWEIKQKNSKESDVVRLYKTEYIDTRTEFFILQGHHDPFSNSIAYRKDGKGTLSTKATDYIDNTIDNDYLPYVVENYGLLLSDINYLKAQRYKILMAEKINSLKEEFQKINELKLDKIQAPLI